MKKRVALFTTFFEAKSGYSLVTVAESQIRMLLGGGYEPVVLVQNKYIKDKDGSVTIEPFEELPPPAVWNRQSVDLRPVVPPLELETDVHEDFDERTEQIHSALQEHLADIDVCITHDVILQEWYKEHNVAMRQYAKERPDLLWLHWIHSCPLPNVAMMRTYPQNSRYTSPPGYVIYPNDADKARVCQTYNLNGREWKVKVCRAGHAIDPLTMWPYSGLTKDLVRKSDLLSGDVVAVYPARLDRGKQPEKIIRLMVGVRRARYEPRLLIVDWQSTGQRFQDYMDELEQLADLYDVSDCVNFTSRLDDRCSTGVPRRVALELMSLSNVYIHPSKIETYSLVVHEAALFGNLLVLNYDLLPMRELFGETAIYFDFSSDRVDREYAPDEQSFWNDEALRLIMELKQNRALMAKTKARREWSPQAQWREFEPLLYLQPVGE